VEYYVHKIASAPAARTTRTPLKEERLLKTNLVR